MSDQSPVIARVRPDRVWAWIKDHRSAVAWVALVAVAFFGLYRNEDTASEAHRIAQTNSRLIAQSNADRLAARQVNCDQKHQTAIGGFVVTKLINDLLHQAIAPQPGASPDQVSAAVAYLHAADQALSEANMHIAAGDCDPTTTTTTVAPG